MNSYYKSIKKSSPPFILIKNKIDLKSLIDDSLVDHIKPKLKAYFEISCYDGQGIDDLKQWFNEFFNECDYLIKE